MLDPKTGEPELFFITPRSIVAAASRGAVSSDVDLGEGWANLKGDMKACRWLQGERVWYKELADDAGNLAINGASRMHLLAEDHPDFLVPSHKVRREAPDDVCVRARRTLLA